MKNFSAVKVWQNKGGFHYSVSNLMKDEIGRISEYDVFYPDTGKSTAEWSLNLHNTLYPFTPEALIELSELVVACRKKETD